jgi:biotin operon repressor
MKDSKIFAAGLFEKIFELNSKNKIGASTITVFTFILYKYEDLQKETVLSDYEMARELGLSRQTVITAKNKLKLLGILNCERNRGFPNRFTLNENYQLKELPKNSEIREILVKDLNPISEPKIIINNLHSKYPTFQQFMDFAKTLEDYSEKLDGLLVQKFYKWENSDWKNVIGKPILNWQSVLEKNIKMLELSLSQENNSLAKIPNIKRPKLD